MLQNAAPVRQNTAPNSFQRLGFKNPIDIIKLLAQCKVDGERVVKDDKAHLDPNTLGKTVFEFFGKKLGIPPTDIPELASIIKKEIKTGNLKLGSDGSIEITEQFVKQGLDKVKENNQNPTQKSSVRTYIPPASNDSIPADPTPKPNQAKTLFKSTKKKLEELKTAAAKLDGKITVADKVLDLKAAVFLARAFGRKVANAGKEAVEEQRLLTAAG